MFAVLRRLRHRMCAPTHPVAAPLAQPAIAPVARVPANDTWRISAEEVKTAAPETDRHTIERQIAALLAAWNKTSLCARREFLTRIDQRIMTTHWITSARGQLGKGAATG